MITSRPRWLPALLLIAAASAASLAPGAFLLEREALGQGEVWRLWTGHLVHHTAWHFVFDVGVAVFLLLLVQRPWAWLVLPPIVGGAVLVARPDLVSYAGLSGVLHGLTVLAGVSLFRQGQGFERFAAGALLAGVLTKALYEGIAGVSVFTGGFDMGAETIYLAHLAGVVGALGMLGVERFAKRYRRSGRANSSPGTSTKPSIARERADSSPPATREPSRSNTSTLCESGSTSQTSLTPSPR